MPPSEELLRDQVLDEIIADVRSGVPDDEDVRRAVDAVRERIARNAEQSGPMSKRRSFVRRHFGKLCLAAAAVIVIVMVLPFHSDRTPGAGVAWADVVKAFDAVQSIHAVQTFRANGEERVGKVWFRKPNHFRMESDDQIIIDNGVDRLMIYRKLRIAQWSDSPLGYEGGSFAWFSDVATAFRKGLEPGIKVTKLDDESTGGQLVYTLEPEKPNCASGKIWVNAESLLIERMVQTLPEGNPFGKPGPFTVEFTFNFDPIPDEMFTPKVPDGFKGVPRPERKKLSGRVLDERGDPVAEARVYVASGSSSGFAAADQTNDRGEFSVVLPPAETQASRLNFPIFLRAYREDDPARVAWTVLRSPDDDIQLVGTIPGESGDVEIDRQGGGWPKCASASGIVLRMEPATYLAGRVTDTDGKPIARASVKLNAHLMDEFGSQGLYCTMGGPGEGGETIARTDDAGRYRLTHLPSFWDKAWLYLKVTAAGYAPRDRKLVIGEDWSRDAVDFELFRAGWTVTGRLIDDHGVPLPDRIVRVLVNGEPVPRPYKATDREGRFRLDNCPSTPGFQLEAELNGDPPPHLQGNAGEPWYYLNVIHDVDPIAEKTHHEVELVARQPAITLNVTVRNTAAEPLPYFPVEVRGDGISLDWQWAKLQVRTDAQGRCTFTGVPRARNLHLRLYSGTTKPDEKLDDAVWKIAEEHKTRYQPIIDQPIELTPGQTTYDIDATVPTREEWLQQKNKPASEPSPSADLG